MNLYYSFLFLTLIGCNNQQPTNHQILLKWNKVYTANNTIHFCQIDSVLNEYIVSLSYFTSLGCEIVKVNATNLSVIEVPFKDLTDNIFFVFQKDSIIGFTKYTWRNKISKHSLYISYNTGDNWYEMNTPLEFTRKFVFTDSEFVVEGTKDGHTALFKSLDKGKTWVEINLLTSGLKGFYLLNAGIFNGKVLGEGSKSYSHKENMLMLLDIDKNKIIELYNLGGENYIKPISSNNLLQGVINASELNIYTLENDRLRFKESFYVPNGITGIRNIYLNEKFYILTAKEGKLQGKILSWISFDKGKNWQPYNQEDEFQLVYNSFGGLFMSNKDNDILKGVY